MSNYLKILVTGTLALGGIGLAAAANADGPPPLPDEAYAACQSKSSGDACKVQLGGHTMEGSCAAHPADGRLFCRPNGPPPPPPEAYVACAQKRAADACTVTMGNRTMDGTCVNGPDGRLVCAPPHPPHPPQAR